MAEKKAARGESKNVAVELSADIRKRLKVYAAGHELKIKDVVSAALDEFLKKRGA